MEYGAGRGNRTLMGLLPPDFESGASTSFAIPADGREANTFPCPSSTLFAHFVERFAVQHKETRQGVNNLL